MKCERQKKATAQNDGLDNCDIHSRRCDCHRSAALSVRARQGGKPLASILNHIFMEVKNETHLYLFPLFFICDVMLCFSTLRSLIRRKNDQ